MSIGLVIVIATFVLIVGVEAIHPARAAVRGRWPVNVGLGALNLVLVRLAGAAGPFALARIAADHGFGLFNQFALPAPLTAILIVILMDGAVYWQHRASHAINWAWALHKLHHADTDFDVTTAVRFHPGEALISMVYKGCAGALLGASPEAMILFETYLSVGSMTEHSNIALPARIDQWIRALWVTPAMHIIHHSAEADDHEHNFGFALSLWDRLFGTYRTVGEGQRIGLPRH